MALVQSVIGREYIHCDALFEELAELLMEDVPVMLNGGMLS